MLKSAGCLVSVSYVQFIFQPLQDNYKTAAPYLQLDTQKRCLYVLSIFTSSGNSEQEKSKRGTTILH